MSKKHTYKYVKDYIESFNGYKLLSTEYKGNKSKLTLRCPKDHIFKMNWNNFQQGQRCPIQANNQKHTYQYIKEQFAKEGYKLLSTEYKNWCSKLELRCPEGHIFKMIWNNFQQGQRCPICDKSKKYIYDEVKQKVENKRYKLLSTEYKNCKEKLELQCPKGHNYKVTFDNFVNNRGCPICSKNGFSTQEKEVLDIVKSFTSHNIIENDRTLIVNPKTGRYLELDLWMPSLNKAIEFNGEHWHSTSYVKYKDNQKQLQCKEKNIDLLIIWYKDWIDNKENCINNIKEFM